MKRVSRGREEADAEHYRASSSLMERPCRECHHLARAGQCGSTRRHLLPRVNQFTISSSNNTITTTTRISIHRVQAHRELSNNGLASGQHRRFCRLVVPHHHPRQKQQGDREQDRLEEFSRRRVELGQEAEVEVTEEEQKEAQRLVTVSISRITGRRKKSWRRRRRRSTGSVAWTQRRIVKPSILN